MACSKFIMMAMLALALIFGTRWCIVTFYSGTYASTDSRGVHGNMQLAAPVKTSSGNKEVSFGAMTPPVQEAQASSGS